MNGSVPSPDELCLQSVARDMRDRFDAPTDFSRAFLNPDNLAPLLADFEREVRVRRRNQTPDMDWGFVYDQIVAPFAAMGDGAARRQFADLGDANLLFWNSMIEPWLLYDSHEWHHRRELAEKRRKGIDASHLRLHPRNPSVLGRGVPRDSNRATRGVGTRHPSTAPYLLSDPWRDGRARQARALELQGMAPLPGAECAYGRRSVR